ncbi:hypothetical protein OENI_10164 [Oenococcus oeni]|nr:hypothetical protein OENI_10164 [Oenococcus oeni]SYW04115.1 hypothetical protein OENI_510011 [Oenococcus oeni]SYW19021.1 hypothetical protein OENI_60166 [Oenococcus oeni]
MVDRATKKTKSQTKSLVVLVLSYSKTAAAAASSYWKFI